MVLKKFVISKFIFISFLGIILQSCSSQTEDSINLSQKGLSPSEFLQGTWVSPVDSLKITFTSDNIIEENLSYFHYQSTNFKIDYPLEEFNISEKIVQEIDQVESYSIQITRKDGDFVDTVIRATSLNRKYEKAIFQGKEAIRLTFPGYSGYHLFKE